MEQFWHKVMWGTLDKRPNAKKGMCVNRLHTYPSDKHVPLTRFWAPYPQHGDGIPVGAAAWVESVLPALLFCSAENMIERGVIKHRESGDIILMECGTTGVLVPPNRFHARS
jgi:hypothetical protein